MFGRWISSCKRPMFSFLYLTNALFIYRSVIFCGFLPSGGWVSSIGSSKFLGLKKVLCRRLRGLGLEEGHHWHYLDAEDFSPNGGAVFWSERWRGRVWYYVAKKCIPYFIFEWEMLEEESGKVFWEMYLANHNQSTTWNSEIVFENKFQPSFPNNKYQLQLIFFKKNTKLFIKHSLDITIPPQKVLCFR